MAGRAASNVITRYAGIQVQTSAMGLQIPLGWGQFRVNCNMLDYLDFKSKPQNGKGGGKGGSPTTGYSYSATIILGLCEGPIDAINIVYVDGKTYSNGSKTALQQAGLTMQAGAIGQSPWSYLTSNHPNHAIGYSGIAITYAANYALDPGATPPNHSFEVTRTTGFGPVTTTTGKDVDPSLVIADFFENPRTGVPLWPQTGLLGDPTPYQNYCLAAGLVLSPVIDQERSASDFLKEVLLATNSTCVWSEGVLKLIPYGDTALTANGKTYTPPSAPIYALNDDDFIVDNPGDPPLQVDIEDQSDAYNVVQLEYLDRTNQYNMAIALASDAANIAQYGARRQDPTTVHVICDPSVAAICAQLYLQRTLYIRAQYKFKLGWMFALLEPGDIIELTDVGLGLVDYPVRVIEIDQDEKYGLSFTCEDYPVGIAHTPLYDSQPGDGYVADRNVDPGGVEANLLLFSGDQTNAVWTNTNATVAGAAATDAYALTTACALIASATSGAHAIAQTVSAFEGLGYSFAVCLQAAAHKIAQVSLNDGAGNSVQLTVDLNAGAITAPASASGNAILIASALSATLVSGVWQLVLTAAFPTATALTAQVNACNDSGALTWTGDAAHAINISQAQLRQGVAIGPYAQTTGAVAGPVLFNPPSVLAQQGEVWAAVAGGPNWGGAIVWVSVDGDSYQQVGTVDGPARFGVVTADFPVHADPDTTDTLAVDLGASEGVLTGASSSAADNGGTMCLVDSELITYEAATLTNPSRYSLGTYLRRGYLNTPIADHAAGAPFVRLDSSVFQFPYLAANVGQTIYVKFQSFNPFGQAQVSLADCIAYPVVPFPAAGAAPGSAWTASAVALANAGVSTPALRIAGHSDNPSATAVIFYYRVTGTSGWISAGQHPVNTTVFNITSVIAGADYDVGVAYLVGGVITAIATIGSGIAVGVHSTGVANGTVLFSTSTPGAFSYTVPSGYALAHVDIVLTGADGDNRYTHPEGMETLTQSGGAGGVATYVSLAVTAGSTTIAGTLVGPGGGAAAVTSPALTAAAGANATLSAPGAGGTATGGTTNTTGANGGASDPELSASIVITART